MVELVQCCNLVSGDLTGLYTPSCDTVDVTADDYMDKRGTP